MLISKRYRGIELKIPVEHIAHLARLSLSESEKELFSGQLGGILEYVRKLNELDTSGVDPTSHVLEMNNVMREDALRSSLPLRAALANAPDRSGNFFRVPKIIE
ncbi:MAG TPA: Asp-tRNA(Asn)/Glu-tRNA(Gln) amidotransferase subunit GatC [Thermodesulfovibrionales bacterium]|nr:Asp-tRNA(Asn)/Glu-tRNA(Gln) amidotransferase subunit GatC [Thermodesulfovibrionales bacterium]